MRHHYTGFTLALLQVSFALCLSFCLFLTGCLPEPSPDTHAGPVETAVSTADSEESSSFQETKTESEIFSQEEISADPETVDIEESRVAESSTQEPVVLRDSSPRCLIPAKDGLSVAGNDSVYVDLSHTDQGYCMLQYTGGNPKVKLQITGPDSITYTYNLGSSCDAFPFTAGNGNYQISVFENISGQQYAVAYSENFSITLENEFLPYLYANQYVNFTENSLAVQKAQELASTAPDDLTVVTNVYNFIISSCCYDYDKAKSVQSGYIPVIDDFISSKTGICFDFASTMAAMLRSQGIPTRLEIGYAGEAYHAWISTYLDEKGWVNGIIEFDGKSWKLMDPTFAASSSEESLKKYIGEGDHYHTKYRY